MVLFPFQVQFMWTFSSRDFSLVLCSIAEQVSNKPDFSGEGEIFLGTGIGLCGQKGTDSLRREPGAVCAQVKEGDMKEVL